jgi:acyl carrier protein
MELSKNRKKAEIFENISVIIADVMKINQNELSLENSFVDDLNSDSIDAVDIHLEIERTFDITLSEEEAENLLDGKVSDLCDLVEMKLTEKGA